MPKGKVGRVHVPAAVRLLHDGLAKQQPRLVAVRVPDLVDEAVRDARHDGSDHHDEDGEASALHAAHGGRDLVPAHEDVAEHGKRDGEPQGHHVARDDVQVVEQDEVHPALGVVVSFFTHRPGDSREILKETFSKSSNEAHRFLCFSAMAMVAHKIILIGESLT